MGSLLVLNDFSSFLLFFHATEFETGEWKWALNTHPGILTCKSTIDTSFLTHFILSTGNISILLFFSGLLHLSIPAGFPPFLFPPCTLADSKSLGFLPYFPPPPPSPPPPRKSFSNQSCCFFAAYRQPRGGFSTCNFYGVERRLGNIWTRRIPSVILANYFHEFSTISVEVRDSEREGPSKCEASFHYDMINRMASGRSFLSLHPCKRAQF